MADDFLPSFGRRSNESCDWRSNTPSTKDFPWELMGLAEGKDLLDLNYCFRNAPVKKEESAADSTQRPDVQILGVGKRGPLDKKLEEELVSWIKYGRHSEPPNSATIREKASELFKAKYPDFKASRGWYYNFLRRHKIKRFRSTLLL